MVAYKINNLEWKVTYVLTFDDDEEEETFGQTIFKDLEIQILQGLNYDVKKRTLIHEVTHAFIFSYGLDQTSIDEEFLCRFMESHAQKILETVDGILLTSKG